MSTVHFLCRINKTCSSEAEADCLRRDLIRALESGYAPDYQELIKRYFDLLQRRNSSGS
ncbi:MAG: hypothetical protein AAGI91_13595 [Bacteroidota bacterium]